MYDRCASGVEQVCRGWMDFDNAFIVDINGCFVELHELLEQVGLSISDAIVPLGEVIDRHFEMKMCTRILSKQRHNEV